MSKAFPGIYLHRFNCGHSESHHSVLAIERNNLDFDHPCVRCEPNTAAGQERLGVMLKWSRFSIPHLAENGDIILGPRTSQYHPAFLSIREKGGNYEVAVMRKDSAEYLALTSKYGMN